MTALSLPWAFVLRDFLIARSYRIGFILTLGSTVGSVLIFYFLSRAIGGSVSSSVSAYGSDYFGFVVIGIAFTQVVTVGLGAIGGSVRQGQVTGTLELMLISPTRSSTALISSGLYSHISAAGTILIYLAVGFLLGLRFDQPNFLVALAAFLLLVVSCNAIGLIGATAVLILKQGNPVNWIVSGASLVLGGVFYPTSSLPEALQVVSQFLPITHALEILRRSLLLGEGLDTLWPRFVALIALVAIYLPIGLWSSHIAVDRAREDGSLAEF
jgi:ABC-2 type transport system permease protein